MRPAKILPIEITSTSTKTNWAESDGSGWVSNQMPYQWTVIMSVTNQDHSWGGSTTPYVYNGSDINVGDYIATQSQGRVYKIVEVTSIDGAMATLVVEDDLRLNTFSDMEQAGDGSMPTEMGLIFEISNNKPILFPLPDILPNTLNYEFATQIQTRWDYTDQERTIYVEQNNHGMAVGNVVALDSTGAYKKLDTGTAGDDILIGAVNSIGNPGAHWFSYIPVGIRSNFALPGAIRIGGYAYVDHNSPGGLLATPAPNGASIPVAIKLSATETLLLDDTGGGGSDGSKVYVLASADELATLTVDEGTMAYVADSRAPQGIGEYALYIYVNAAWVILSTEDSVRSDARSYLTTLLHTGGATTSLVQIGHGCRVVNVNVDITEAFATDAQLRIGDVNDMDRLMADSECDLSVLGNYETSPNYIYDTTQEHIIEARYVAGSSTAGTAKITITYV